MINDLIWDVDGTIFDTYPAFTLAMSKAIKDAGAIVPLNRVTHLLRVSFAHCVESITKENRIDSEVLSENFYNYYTQIPLQNQPPFRGVGALCEYMLTLGGRNLIVTHRSNKSTAELLRVHNLEHCFSDLITTGDGYARKPDPAMFLASLERNRLPRETTLSIGDREIDAEAANAAGLRAALFQPGDETAAANITFRSYAQLLELVRSENMAGSELNLPGIKTPNDYITRR